MAEPTALTLLVPPGFIEAEISRQVAEQVAAYVASLPPPPAPDPLLSIKEVAAELDLHPETVTELMALSDDHPRRLHFVRTGSNPALPQGRKVRRSQLNDWLQRQSSDAPAAPPPAARPPRTGRPARHRVRGSHQTS